MYRAHITQKDGPERTQEVREKLVTVGRAEEGNVLVLPRGNVSKSHATLEFLGDSWVLSDLASTNGTYLNGKRIGQPSTVWPGDRIHIGDFMMRFELLDGPDSVSEVSALEIDLESDESDEFDDNPTAFRAEGLSAAAVVPNRRSTAASLLATHASTAQDADLAPVADGDDPPTAGLMHHNVAPMVNADTRKASVRLSLVSLIERFLATPKALQKAAVLARGAASSAELRR